MLALSTGTTAAASNFGNGIVVGKQADFSTNINLQGNTLDFNKGSSKIYDDGQLHIATDDYIFLNAPVKTIIQNDLQVGKSLIINYSKDGTDTGSKIYDNAQLHIATDDYLYLDAPISTYVQNALVVGGSLTVNGSIGLPVGSVISSNILDGTIVNADVSSSAAIADSKLATISTAGKVSNSATTATSANTASAIVARDGSGNFTVGTITGSLTGAASLNVLKAGDSMTGTLSVTPVSGNAINVNGGMFTVVGSNGNTAIAGTLAVTGAVTGATYNKLTVTTPATGATLTVADGKTLTVNNTLAFSGTDSTAFILPSASDTLVGRTSTDTLTNKTLDNPIITGNTFFSGGHLVSVQTTPPVTLASITGISASACVGCTDVRGTITTTGTASTTGTVTVTFDTAYIDAPVVVITPANATGLASTPFISSVTTTDFTITAAGVAGATPSWNYMVME
jgi:hypothetical protein